MEVKELVKKAHENAVNKGFWDDWFSLKAKRSIHVAYTAQFLMLIVSELSEALEALRKKDNANLREELADVAIRLADLCGGLEIDLESEILKKMEKNLNRPYKHGKEF